MIGERVRQIRELNGWTQAELAGILGVVQSAVAQIESGAYVPTETALESLAFRTGFDLSFFRQIPSPVQFPVGTFLYRAQARVTAKEKARAHRYAQLIFEFVLRMRDRLRPIPVLLPRLVEGPSSAALTVRAAMGLSPDSPVSNLMTSIERLGVIVIDLPPSLEGLDGFSSWVGLNGQLPVMCVVREKSGYRQRFTLGEELGHLMMHFPFAGTVKQADEEARRFAGELLLPEAGFRADLPSPLTLASLVPLKSKWKVSFQFMARRALDINVISANQFRYLQMQISSKGWRMEEPGDATAPKESPQAIRTMIELLYGNPLRMELIRKDATGLPPTWLKSLSGMVERGDSSVTVQFPKRS